LDAPVTDSPPPRKKAAGSAATDRSPYTHTCEVVVAVVMLSTLSESDSSTYVGEASSCSSQWLLKQSPRNVPRVLL
jgi:hypothetical protein